MSPIYRTTLCQLHDALWRNQSRCSGRTLRCDGSWVGVHHIEHVSNPKENCVDLSMNQKNASTFVAHQEFSIARWRHQPGNDATVGKRCGPREVNNVEGTHISVVRKGPGDRGS